MSLFLASPSGAWLLGALVGIAGVLAGLLAARMPSLPFKGRIAKKAAARELAMATILSLEDFVGDCFAAAHDDPQFNPDDPEEFIFNTPDPSPVLPNGADWALLPAELADEIRWIPVRARNIVDGLQSLDISMPNYGDLFERRQHDFSRLGLLSLDVIGRLGREFGITTPERPDYYQPREGFEYKIDDIQARWNRRSKVVESAGDGVSNVTSLFGGSREDGPSR